VSWPSCGDLRSNIEFNQRLQWVLHTRELMRLSQYWNHLWGSWAVVLYLQTLQHSLIIPYYEVCITYNTVEIKYLCRNERLNGLKTYFLQHSIDAKYNDWELRSEKHLSWKEIQREFRKTFHAGLTGDWLNSLSLWLQETGKGCWSVLQSNSYVRGKNRLLPESL